MTQVNLCFKKLRYKRVSFLDVEGGGVDIFLYERCIDTHFRTTHNQCLGKENWEYTYLLKPRQ